MVFIFWIVASVLIFYLVFILWMRLGLRKVKQLSPNPTTPTVSVVIAARNEEWNISGLLDALKQQSYPADRLEIIVIDDGSTDGTGRILTSFAEQMSNLQYNRLESIPPGWAPKKWALTSGIDCATGEIILTTDADCRPGPEWVATMVGHFNCPSTGMVVGPSPLVSERRSLWWEALLLDSCAMDALTAGGASQGLALTCTGRNLAYRRQTYEDVGGFKGVEHFVSGDDDLLMQKVAASGNWRITFALNDAATVTSPPPATLGAFIRQRLRFASKGRYYFGLDTGPGFKLILPFLYLANLAALAGLVMFAITLDPLWLVPVAVKIGAEALLVYPYMDRIKRRVRVVTFIVTALVHPLYVVLFGALGNLHKLAWKERRYEGPQVSTVDDKIQH